jgi:hypothetical protein
MGAVAVAVEFVAAGPVLWDRAAFASVFFRNGALQWAVGGAQIATQSKSERTTTCRQFAS